MVLSCAVFWQTSASLGGTVRDPKGNAVVGAKIVSNDPAKSPPFPAGPHDTKVIAHYYGWWEGPDSDWAAKPWHTPFSLLPAIGWSQNQFGQAAIDAIHKQIAEARAYSVYGFSWEYNGSWSDTAIPILRDTFLAANDSAPNPIHWMIVFDSDQWAQRYGYFDSSAHIEFNDDHAAATQFDDEIRYLCDNYASDPNYIHVDGGPAIFLYGLNRWVGPDIARAIDGATAACNGTRPYIIGDFQLTARQFPTEAGPLDYASKGKLVDAISDYTMFGGYGYYWDNDSTYRYAFDTTGWDYAPPGKTRLDVFFANGQAFAKSSGKPFYPGLEPQYFKISSRDCATCQGSPLNNDPYTGYLPTARQNASTDVIAESRAAIKAEWDHMRQLPEAPRFAFVTSWNEPVEGTMIDASVGTNSENYAMLDDFLRQIRQYTQGADRSGGEFTPFRVLSPGSERFLATAGNPHAAGTGMRLTSERDAQLWRLIPWYPDGATFSGHYLLIDTASNYCLTAQQSQVAQQPCAARAGQLWDAQANPPRYGRITNTDSGLALQASGSVVELASPSNADVQQWLLQRAAER